MDKPQPFFLAKFNATRLGYAKEPEGEEISALQAFPDWGRLIPGLRWLAKLAPLAWALKMLALQA